MNMNIGIRIELGSVLGANIKRVVGLFYFQACQSNAFSCTLARSLSPLALIF